MIRHKVCPVSHRLPRAACPQHYGASGRFEGGLWHAFTLPGPHQCGCRCRFEPHADQRLNQGKRAGGASGLNSIRSKRLTANPAHGSNRHQRPHPSPLSGQVGSLVSTSLNGLADRHRKFDRFGQRHMQGGSAAELGRANIHRLARTAVVNRRRALRQIVHLHCLGIASLRAELIMNCGS